MSKLIMVTGGARSGKSHYAEETSAKLSEKVVYIATATPLDDEMTDRIKKHQESRKKEWLTIETYNNIDTIITKWNQEYLNLLIKYGNPVYRVYNPVYNTEYKNPLFLLDCVSIMVSNLMLDNYKNWDKITVDNINMIETRILKYVDNIISAINKVNADLIIVTNEVGFGIVPDNLMSRVFRDILGRVNQKFAKAANEVVLCISGVSMQIKK